MDSRDPTDVSRIIKMGVLLSATAQPEYDLFVTASGVELSDNWTHAVSPTL